MKQSLSLKVVLALCSALAAFYSGQASAQSFSDSTGGSSQARGELAATPSGIVPNPIRPIVVPVGAVASYSPANDSTGGTSSARAAYLLAHATTHSDAADTLARRDSYQPFLDSTGGTSEARAERDLTGRGAMDVASSGPSPINDAH